MPFPRNGVDLPCLCHGGGHTEFDISDEGLDSGETPVSSGSAITSLLFDVSEDVKDQRDWTGQPFVDIVRQTELDQNAEVRRLKAELKRVTEERDIL